MRLSRKVKRGMIVLFLAGSFSLVGCSSGSSGSGGGGITGVCQGKKGRTWISNLGRFIWCVDVH